MPSTIKQFYEWLTREGPSDYQLDLGEDEMLVRLPVGGGRWQTVRINIMESANAEFSIVRLQSRACVASDYRIVSELLEANARSTWGGFVLNRSVTPNVIDVTCSFVAEHTGPHNLLPALQRIGGLADQVEASVTGKDEF